MPSVSTVMDPSRIALYLPVQLTRMPLVVLERISPSISGQVRYPDAVADSPCTAWK